ncbi:MAG: TolC family protein [Candidatus Neomarinimicrobiota bacterium]
MNRSAAVFFIILVGFVGPGRAQTTSITLEGYLNLVTENHPLFARERLSQEVEEQDRARLLGARDMRVVFAPSYVTSQPLPVTAFTPERVDQQRAALGVEKAIWGTGGRLAFSLNTDRLNQPIDPISFPGVGTITSPSEFYQQNLALTYTQPLLQNFRGQLDRLGYELSQYTVEMAALQALENREAFLLRMGSMFLEWTALGEQLAIAGERLRLTEQQLQQVESKRRANLVDEVDVLRSEDAGRIARQGLLLVESQWAARRVELAVLARAPELESLTPDFDLYQRVDHGSSDELLGRLKQDSRLLALVAKRRAQLERRHRGLEELTRPQLNLVAQLARKGGHEALESSFAFDKSDAGLFLQFNYPLGNRGAVAEVRKSRLELRRNALEKDEILLDLEAGVRKLLIQIEDFGKILTLNEEQIETARRKTTAELERYNSGRGELTFVIQSQDNEERARLAYATNAATYHTLDLQLQALMDDLLGEKFFGVDRRP